MIPTNTDNISCLIFGHNFYKETDSETKKEQLVCKHCQAKVAVDHHGNFETSPTADKTFENTLRRLFLLRRKLAV